MYAIHCQKTWLLADRKWTRGKTEHKKIKIKIEEFTLSKRNKYVHQIQPFKSSRRSDTNGLMYSIQILYFFPLQEVPTTLKPLVKVLHIPLHLGEPVLQKRSISLLIEDNVLRIHNSHCTLHNASETQLKKNRRDSGIAAFRRVCFLFVF